MSEDVPRFVTVPQLLDEAFGYRCGSDAPKRVECDATAAVPPIIDVRPLEQYAARHIRGSTSIPLDTLHNCLMELPPRDATSKVVLYAVGFASEPDTAASSEAEHPPAKAVHELLTKTGYLVKGLLVFDEATFNGISLSSSSVSHYFFSPFHRTARTVRRDGHDFPSAVEGEQIPLGVDRPN